MWMDLMLLIVALLPLAGWNFVKRPRALAPRLVLPTS